MQRRHDDARATAFTGCALRNSIASDLVAAFKLPFVNEARQTERRRSRGRPSSSYLHDMTAALFFHLGHGELRDVKEAGDVDVQDRREVGLGILGKWLGDEDAGVVDERVDAPKPAETFGNRAFGRLPIGDVAGDDQDVGVARGLNRPCRRDYAVVAIEVHFDERRSDTLRCPVITATFCSGAIVKFLYFSEALVRGGTDRLCGSDLSCTYASLMRE